MIQMTKEIKEAYKIFFMVKGHLDCTPQTALASADGYFRRLWADGSNGAPLYDYEQQFEQAWEDKYGKQEDRRIDR